jgi:mannose-6-phosphate isomerase-like protein (cupin superfamily)
MSASRHTAGPVVDTNRLRGRYFEVMQETGRSQTAVMTIGPGEDAGPEEIHPGDQIIFVIEGQARVRVGEAVETAGPGACVMIPAGTRHHVENPGAAALFCLTVYAPPVY